MRINTHTRATLTAVALVVSSLVATMPVAEALVVSDGDANESAATSSSSCELYALQPVVDGNTVIGRGGRQGCTSIRTVTVVLRQDIAWAPDRTLDTAQKRGDNVHLTVSHMCEGHTGGMRVFVETRNGTGGKVQSPRTTFDC